MLDGKVFSDIVSRVYEGGHDPQAWTSAIEKIVETYGMRFGIVAVLDHEVSNLTNSAWVGCDEGRFLRGRQEYEEEWHQRDPGLRLIRQYPRSGLLDVTRHPDFASAADQVYADFNFRSFGSRRWIVAHAPEHDRFAFGFAAHFTDPDDPIFEKGVESFWNLFKHMHHAMRLAARPPQFTDPDALTMIVDRDLRVVEMTAAVEVFFGKRDGLQIRQGRLDAAQSDEHQSLAAACRSATTVLDSGGSGALVRITSPSGMPALILRVKPLVRSVHNALFGNPLAVVEIRDPDTVQSRRAEEWQHLFGFTPAECRVATRLLETEGTLRNVADELGISYATARVHLARMFEKADVRTQAQLTRLLLRTQL